MEELQKDTPQEENVPKFRGLYRYVKIPVKALDWIIGICIAVIVIVVVFEMVNPGLKVTFDSNGGTDVPVQKQMYGELLEEPEDPVREGYTFTGWYKDPACDDLWDVETDTIESDTNLYAGWQKNE
jgi:uncharacterized repeat protein (TIGR02543 family)